MLNIFDYIHSNYFIDFNFSINNDYSLDDLESNNDEVESNLIFNNNSFFKENINYISSNFTNNNFIIEHKLKNKKFFCHTKKFIKSLLDLSLTPYEVNHIAKLIKTSWLFGIYFLLNKSLNYLFNKNKFKIAGFAFEFIYFKVSLIETDNTEENLNIFNISVKDLLTGNILNKKNIKEKNVNRINKIKII